MNGGTTVSYDRANRTFTIWIYRKVWYWPFGLHRTGVKVTLDELLSVATAKHVMTYARSRMDNFKKASR